MKIPLEVFEIVLGILLGPSLLGWVQPNGFTDILANFGLAMLFFLAGNEIDFARIAGRPMKRASLGWLISLGVGVAAGILFSPTLGAGVFTLITGAAIWLAAIGAGRSMHTVITATLHTSGQVAVRLVILVLVSLVGLSVALGIDMLVGAFAAGVLYRVLLTGAPEPDAKLVEAKIEALGFGFLVPIFFINTGVTFDVDSVVGDPRALPRLHGPPRR